ncbi:MAG: type II toxin-antitoxin system MqsR family toxin [Deltaproteobacteria bacterium]|nr:type II toxin-antitoxin system MqsR family toxin [Deltaproteobacteria bacterium]
MEKKKRHYSLSLIKEFVSNGNWQPSWTALKKAREQFDFVKKDIEHVVLNLETSDFYKSMTSHDDSTVWQDVYRPFIGDTQAYIKLSIIDNATLLIQFKRK